MFPGFALIMMVRFGNMKAANVLTFGLLMPMFIICSGVCKMEKICAIFAYVIVLVFAGFALVQHIMLVQDVQLFCKVFGG
jgi:hypothetical protein